MTLKKAVKFSDLIFEKSEEGKKRKRPVVSGDRRNVCATPPFAQQLMPDELKTLVDDLRACNSSALFCKAVESNNFQPCKLFTTSCYKKMEEQPFAKNYSATENSLANTVLNILFSKMSTKVMESMELQHNSMIIDLVGVSQEQALNICLDTKMQNKSTSWYTERKKRITASVFGKVMNRRETIYPASIVKSIIDQKKTQSMPASLKWGIENEKVALDDYIKNNLGTNSQEVMESGLVINPKYPWLGCSPDGIVIQNGSPVGCIEIKCPFSKKDATIQEAIGSDKSFFLCNKDKIVHLKRNHLYYYQCQGVLNILELPWLDFVVYTTKELFVERIFIDSDLWNNKMLPKLTSFYVDFIFPALLKDNYK